MTWSVEIVEAALRMRETGAPHKQISSELGVPASSLRNWFYRRIPTRTRPTAKQKAGPFVMEDLPPAPYAYLLGAYLGDGYMSRQSNGSWLLRIMSDTAYPGILDEFAVAMEAVSGGTAWRRKKTRVNAMEIGLTWWHWTNAIPQHGPGRKHSRKIELEIWQWAMVSEHTGLFLRGLIHTDGWRGLNRVHVKGKDYAYPRYQFSNRSDDIRRIFCIACDMLDIEWRPWGRWHISVARRDAVAKLDQFVGLKY